MGLHLFLYQEVPLEPGILSCRSRRGDDDRAFHARLRAALGEDLPSARAPRQWAEWRRKIPIKNDPAANEAALAKVREDKFREVSDGCDGTWVAHPGLVPIAKAVFDEYMPRPNQYDRQRPDVSVTAKDLLDFRPEGPITRPACANNISVGIQYFGGVARRQRLRAGIQSDGGCGHRRNLTLSDLAVDAFSKGKLQDGRKVTQELFRKLLAEELPKVKTYLGDEAWNAGKYEEGAKLLTVLPLTIATWNSLPFRRTTTSTD